MQQIAQRHLDKLNKLLEEHTSNNDSFLKGKLGLVFYYYHLYKATEQSQLKHKAEDLLDQILAGINAHNPGLIGPVLSTGGAGLGYAVNFMAREGLLEMRTGIAFNELDRYLFNTAASLIAEDNIDFLHGALGIVYYFTEKKEDDVAANSYLDLLIEMICRKAVEGESGCWFKTSLMKVGEKQKVNFSLAHGMCGILLVLLNAFERSSHSELIAKTVRDGIRFIVKHKMDVDFLQNEYSFFPFVVDPDENEISAFNRMAWSYGDLNEVLLFYRAGSLFHDDSLIRLADLIGMQCMMRRDEPSTLITGSDFYHGTAGLAQFCRTLYRETQHDIYKDVYEYWIERTILLLDEELENGTYHGREHEYLEGLIGVAFVLLSYVSEKELGWSKALLL